jgi:hypothetical protein
MARHTNAAPVAAVWALPYPGNALPYLVPFSVPSVTSVVKEGVFAKRIETGPIPLPPLQ